MERKAARQYLARVKRALVCGKADRRRILGRFKALLDIFQQENPEADYADFVAAFGEPAVCAAELLSSLGEAKMEAAQQKCLRFYRIAVLGLAAALMALSCFWYAKSRRFIEVNDGGRVTSEGD